MQRLEQCVQKFGIQKQKLWLKYRNIRDIPATIAANATSGTMCTKIREKIRKSCLKYVNPEIMV
jgi:hypothetical protein